ncbi:hypothetical protein BS47DRAFT_1370017, partial [Hydnum rufescens UP504]
MSTRAHTPLSPGLVPGAKRRDPTHQGPPWQHAKQNNAKWRHERWQRKPHTRCGGCVVLYVVIDQKQQKMMMGPTNDGWPDETQMEPHTCFGGCVVISRPPPNETCGPPDETWDQQPTTQGDRKRGQDHTPAEV